MVNNELKTNAEDEETLSRFHIISLYDAYSKMLTIKQQNYFRLYYFQDLSLTEIGDRYGITRQAVLDVLKKTSIELQDFEQKLGFVKIQSEILKYIKSLDNKKIQENIIKILENH